jgi:hypothetical protein
MCFVLNHIFVVVSNHTLSWLNPPYSTISHLCGKLQGHAVLLHGLSWGGDGISHDLWWLMMIYMKT